MTSEWSIRFNLVVISLKNIIDNMSNIDKSCFFSWFLSKNHP